MRTEEQASVEIRSALVDMLREEARRMLQQAIEPETATYIEEHMANRDSDGRRMVVRNGNRAVYRCIKPRRACNYRSFLVPL